MEPAQTVRYKAELYSQDVDGGSYHEYLRIDYLNEKVEEHRTHLLLLHVSLTRSVVADLWRLSEILSMIYRFPEI